MNLVRHTVTAVLVLGGIGACGGSSTNNTPRVSTGLPPSEPMSQLTDAQAKQACQALADAVNAGFGGATSTAFSCTVFALASTSTPTTCQSQAKDCEANPPSNLTTMNTAPDCSQASASGLSNCTATVSEFESCASDFLATLRTFEAEFNCSAAGDLQKLQQIAKSQPTQPASCTKLNQECPGSTFGTGSGTGGGGGRTIPGYGSPCTSTQDCTKYRLVCDTGTQKCVECRTNSDCIAGMTCEVGACRGVPGNTGGTGGTGTGGSGGVSPTGGAGGTPGGAGGAGGAKGGMGGAP